MSMQETIEKISARGKGILAADESTGTMGKRLATLGLENEENYRRQFRSLLATTENLSQHISGVILYEETFQQKTDAGVLIGDAFKAQGIVPGIKVDKGLISLQGSDEKATQGLDSLDAILETHKALGAGFAKWRVVFNISNVQPSDYAIHVNATLLARYAKICQSHDIVPIVEPEVLMDGSHTLERCSEVTEAVLKEVFAELNKHNVALEHIILKPNMIIPGKDATNQEDAKAIARTTLGVFKRTIPESVPTVNFLSGGQTEVEATQNLHAINADGPQPWNLSFSYGRALQASTLKAWKGVPENVKAAQDTLLKRAKLNGLAAVGDYNESLEA